MDILTKTAPFRYRGQSSRYVDIATRDTLSLGLSMDYAIHPSNIGCFILRFVVHGPLGQKPVSSNVFTHFAYREKAAFMTYGAHKEAFKGVRLNKIALQVFSPAIHPHELATYTEKFNFWPLLTEWVAEQVQAEGFTLTVDLQNELKSMLIPTSSDEVKCVIEFPNLAEMKQQLTKAAPEKDDEDDETEDEDEDEKPEKDWLN